MPELTEFAGLPVVEFPEGATRQERLERIREQGGDPSAPSSMAWRLRMEEGSDEEYAEYFAWFLSEVDTEHVRALVIGCWPPCGEQGPDHVVELLVEHAEALSNLRSVFVGDISAEERELSWIIQGDLAPLLAAFPQLEELAVKGANEDHEEEVLRLHVPSHPALRSLTLESGGLPGRVVREVVSSGLPALEHLGLWLGVEHYGGTTSPEDLAPVLSGEAFHRLRYLGVRNAEKLDEWIPVLADAPVTQRLEVLDLSLGTLSDKGGQALLGRAEAFSGLRKLDLHHHYLGEEMMERVRSVFATAGVEVVLSDQGEFEDGDGDEMRWLYTAASE